MQTYSHYILTWVLNRQLRSPKDHLHQRANTPFDQWFKQTPPLQSKAALLGSVAPDIPLTTLAIATIIADRLNDRASPTKRTGTSQTEHLFSTLFFKSRWVKALHNVFHGPLLTMAYLILGYLAWQRGKWWGSHLFWFGLACTLHTVIDIPLHYNDGPLLFFPFDWETRFYSPLSYWDPAHHGRAFFLFEHGLMILLLFYLIKDWRANREATRR